MLYNDINHAIQISILSKLHSLTFCLCHEREARYTVHNRARPQSRKARYTEPQSRFTEPQLRKVRLWLVFIITITATLADITTVITVKITANANYTQSYTVYLSGHHVAHAGM